LRNARNTAAVIELLSIITRIMPEVRRARCAINSHHQRAGSATKQQGPPNKATPNVGCGSRVDIREMKESANRQDGRPPDGRGVAGWIMARTLPPNERTVENLLQRGWIEQQHQGPRNEVFLRLTDKGLEAKKSPIPMEHRRMVELGLKVKEK
jgi:hypothetical protein